MCDQCEEFPVQYVAYFNKAGGKLWRPAGKAAPTPWAIDIRPVEPADPSRSKFALRSSERAGDTGAAGGQFRCEETRSQ